MLCHYVKLVATIAALCCLGACRSEKTQPIVDVEGQEVKGSVATLEPVTLGGVEQWILIRGESVDNPILLKLHGGPGQAEMATVGMNRLLEKNFIVVEWDQRGAGKSADAIQPESAMTVERFVEDTHELTQLLLGRFHRKRLILVGSSWGSVIGLKTVQKYPDLYRAFVSTGQIANYLQGLQVGYHYLLNEARRRNDADALIELMELGVPPYLGSEAADKREIYENRLESYGALWHSAEKFDRFGWMISSVEYAWPEKLRFERAAQKSFNLLLPQLMAIDMNSAVPQVEVPVYFAVGRYDHVAPFEVSQQYFSALIAPQKEWIWFENSAHFPQWEEKEKFHDLLTNRVLPETRSRE